MFCKHAQQISALLPTSSKEIFLQRLESNLVSNDSQARCLTLKVLQQLPSFLQVRLNVQHLILHILTTTNDQKERKVATSTIQKISSQSDLFAKSIMAQIEMRILSTEEYFDHQTCAELVQAMANVPGDTSTVLMFYQTIERLYKQRKELRAVLIRSLLRITLKAPILYDLVFEFVKSEPLAVEVLSKKYSVIYPTQLDAMKKLVGASCNE